MAILARLDTLSFRHKVLFAVLVCERMLSSYIYFHNKEKWWSVSILKEVLAFLYALVLNGNIDTPRVDYI